MHHFVNKVEAYKRNYSLLPTYVEEMADYLARQTGKPMEECREFVGKSIAPGGRFALQIPEVLVLEKDKNHDRYLRTVPFDQLLTEIQETRQIFSPSMTAYKSPDDQMSFLAEFIDVNLSKRKKAKHEMFVAKMAGDKTLAAIKKGEQTSIKTSNNSLSGAHSSPFTILWNKSSHSSLTSGCRTATSYGNANNEKFLYGNRLYWSPEIVKANIISIINHTDYEKLAQVMQQFKLTYPTHEQTMEGIRRSCLPYWRSTSQMLVIESLVKSLTPLERAAFLFTGDLYHLAVVNPQFVRQFIRELSTKATTPIDEPKIWVKKMDANLVAFVSLLCGKELDGATLNEVEDKPEQYGIIGATAKNIIETLDRYIDLIRTLWVTDNVPASIFYLPNIVRRGAITSDTDSTIFTVQWWTEWYVGKLDFSETSVAVANTMIYLGGQTIRHILATFSANMGVAKKDIFRLSMKNEYYFPIFTLTSRAKHYFAYMAAQEGNVFKVMETEIKGVALRNSNVSPSIMQQAKAMMLGVMDTVMAEKKIKIRDILKEIAEIENSIRHSVESGEYRLLSKTRINPQESYKNPASSNYVYYQMWEEVFAPKYGHAPAPPYVAIKASIDADNPTKLREWLARIEDRAMAERLEAWLRARGRSGIAVMLLPEQVLSMTGVPKEVIAGIDIRPLIAQTMEAFYLILESLGIYMRNDNNTRLVSDTNWSERKSLASLSAE